MQEWEKDKIWIWFIAAARNKPSDYKRYYIDIENHILFNFERVDDISIPTKNRNSKYLNSNQSYRDYIDASMNKLNNNGVIEFPSIDKSFPMLEDPNASSFSNKDEDIEKMNNTYRCMKYSEKILAELGIDFESLKIK